MTNNSASSTRGKPPCLVVVNYHFPPDGSVGGLRWAGFSKYLAKLGWEVHVVTAAEKAVSEQPDLHIHVVQRGKTLNDLYNYAVGKLRARSSSNAGPATTQAQAPAQNAVATRPGLMRRIRTEMSAWLSFPDYTRGWIFRAAFRTRSLVRRVQPDVVITSGPPHTAHLVGVMATMGQGVPLMLDLRDPWMSFVVESQKAKIPTDPVKRFLEMGFERLAFQRASGIITNSTQLATVMREHYADMDVTWMPNGVDPSRFPSESKDPFPGLNLAYVGTLYVGRDLGPVLQALARFFARNPAAVREGTRLRVAGHMTDTHEARFRSQLHTLGLEREVEFLGVLKPAGALDLLNRSNLAIVLAQAQELQVPAKIYESVGLRIPTLVITEAGSASATESERIGSIAVEPTDVEAICRVFERLWSGELPSRQDPREPIDYPHLAARMSALLLRRKEAGPFVRARVEDEIHLSLPNR